MNDDPESTTEQNNWKTRLGLLFQAPPAEPSSMDEVLNLLRSASANGVITSEALHYVEGALHVSEMSVREVMIPRAQMVVIHEDDTPDTFLPQVLENAHSRYPVVGDSNDEVIGILLAKDLLRLTQSDRQDRFVMRDFLREVTFIPESKRLNTLLYEFRTNRNHMAIVLDEYGGVAGLVTIEDVLEQIVGEIADEHDFEEENNIRQTSINQWMVDASTEIKDFNNMFGTAFPEDQSDTIAGCLLQHFGHIPERGETLELAGLVFEIMKSDNRRIQLIQVDKK
jgi:magnesium and cobalt transporter